MQIVEWNGVSFIIITCDCGYACREKHLCRHCQCVLNENPSLDHFHPKCYKSHFNFMFRNMECTKMIEEYDDLFKSRKRLIFRINKYNGYVAFEQNNLNHQISNLFLNCKRFLPSPPLSSEHAD